MTPSASPWYESGTFWSISVGAVVAAGAAVLGAWATLRAATSKGRLTYCLRKNIALLNADDQIPISLSVVHGSTSVQNPRLVEIQVRNEGRRDIVAGDFHGAIPIKFNLGAPVVALLGIDRHPEVAPEPDVTHEETFLKINPSLIPRGQLVSFSVLIDKEEEVDVEVEAALVDVRVGKRHVTEEAAVSREKYSWTLFACCILFVLLALASSFSFRLNQDLRETRKDLDSEYNLVKAWIKHSKQLEKDLDGCRKKGS
ncbi:hypothetical protein ABZ250_09790 [Streptomyces afghaniensis]|uniref:hypothetical protein n=1 Tax=Streptomyces afghaniensis TaxID=66865 RepID=UPI0033AEA6EA